MFRKESDQDITKEQGDRPYEEMCCKTKIVRKKGEKNYGSKC